MSLRTAMILLGLLTLGVSVGTPLASAVQSAQNQAVYQTAVAGNSSQFHTAEFGSIRDSVSARGKVEADDIIQTSLLIGGQVAEVNVEEGDYVYAGDILLTLDGARKKIALDRAVLNEQLAQLQLEDLLEVDPDDIAIAEAQLEAAQAAYSNVANRVTDEDIQAAELRYQQAQEALTAAQQARQGADGNAEYIASLDAQIGEASFAAEIARLQVEDLRGSNQGDLGAAGAKIRRAELRLDQVRAGADEFAIERQQIAIERAQTQREQAELNYARTVLYAPSDGIVSGIFTEVGERVSAGQSMIEITDMLPMQVIADVDEVRVRDIVVGQPVQVELDALPGVPLTGIVQRIPDTGKDISGILYYQTEIALDVVDARIRDGMSASINIVLDEKTGVLVVPTRFVFENANGAYVNVLQADGTKKQVNVQVGTHDDTMTEILAGLQAGDIVAAN